MAKNLEAQILEIVSPFQKIKNKKNELSMMQLRSARKRPRSWDGYIKTGDEADAAGFAKITKG